MESAETLYKILETKILDLLKSQRQSQFQIEEMREEIERLNEKLTQQRILNEELKDKNEALKIANAIGGNDEHKRLMKLKINRLAKEIDKCIQLIDYTTP